MARSGLDYQNMGVPVVSRKEHIREFGRTYQPGQHLTALGPSGRGKTRLVGQLLTVTISPKFQSVLVHGKIKGRDKTIEALSKDAHMPITPVFPASQYHRRIRHRNVNGWILRPLEKPGDDEEQENELLRREFAKAIRSCYHTSHSKPKILVLNEAHQAHNDLRLRGNIEAPLMRGRPDCAVWAEIQRARHVSYMHYDQAEHVYIFYDPDVDNQRRYSEIGGGSDPHQLRDIAASLESGTRTVSDGSTISPALHFRRSGNLLEIIDT